MRKNNPDPLILSSALFLGAAGAIGAWWYFRDSDDYEIEDPPEETFSATGKTVDTPHTSGDFPISLDAQRKITKFISLSESNENYSLLYTGREFSYGVMQANLDAGRIAQLLAHYQAKGGKYAKHFAEFADWEKKAELTEFQSKRDSAFLSRMKASQKFQKLLKAAGDDPVMQSAQREYFTATYLHPAWVYANQSGWLTPISYLVMAAYFIQYGPGGASRRAQTAKSTPGGELPIIRKLVQNTKAETLASLRRRGYKPKIIEHDAKKHNTFLYLAQSNPYFTQPISYMGKTF